MKVIVQKFGGTSLRDEIGRDRAYKHIMRAIQDGYKVVCVVSAMGRNGDAYATDTLLSLVNPNHLALREKDLLLSCGEVISSIVFTSQLNTNALHAVALTGAQAGFQTNEEHTNAKIIEMKCERIVKELNNADVVVVAGFQGMSKNGEITTLGRGGSDTSAAALGAALSAEYIDIFTDVEGVMTADPRIVKDAQPISRLTYNEICNLAYQGAKVIHPRAVEIAMQAKIPIRIRSTYSDSLGTLVTSMTRPNKGQDIAERLVTGIAHVKDVTQVQLVTTETSYEMQSEVFKAMASANISVDFININPQGLVYTVSGEKTDEAVQILQNLGYEPKIIPQCAKISAVGAGMTGVPGVTAIIVDALSKAGIQILQSADSHTTIWVLVKEKDMVKAVNALHHAFELEKLNQSSKCSVIR